MNQDENKPKSKEIGSNILLPLIYAAIGIIAMLYGFMKANNATNGNGGLIGFLIGGAGFVFLCLLIIKYRKK
jgi:hypothetical protein